MQNQTLDHQEIEWQFDADGSVEGWLEETPAVSGLRVVPETKELTDTYYDTEDWRFYRAGYALRVRRDGKRVEATMKSLAPPEDGGLKRRREISEPLRSDGPKPAEERPRPVGERLRLLAGARDVRPLFGVRTRRRIFELRPEAGEPETTAKVVVGPEGDIRRKEDDSEETSAEDITVDALGAYTDARGSRPRRDLAR